jgi:hypothetical protein
VPTKSQQLQDVAALVTIVAGFMTIIQIAFPDKPKRRRNRG